MPTIPATDTEKFYREFSTTVLVTRYASGDSETNTSVGSVNGNPTIINTGTDLKLVPIVRPSFVDPGITITTAPGEFTISGSYLSIHPVNVQYIDLKTREIKNTIMPISTSGVYEKISQVVSPALGTKYCDYTVTSYYGSATTTISTSTSTQLIGGTPTIVSVTVTSTNYASVAFTATFRHNVVFDNYSTVSTRILEPLLKWQPGP